MGKPEFKSPRRRNPLTATRPLSRSKVAAAQSSANIKVIVRVRPPNEREQQDNYKIVVKIVDEQILVFDPKVTSQAFFYHGVEQKGRDLLRKANKDLQFMFDRVFSYEASNQELFESTTKNLIHSLMEGCNCSVFAYGATGAGKTHTMIGQTDNPGITYLTMAELFKAQEELSEERNFELGISYIEVYNELVQDLLNPGRPLQLRDDGKYGVMVAGIKIHKIQSANELFSLLAQGNANRTQHPTDANAESSRSHAVFQVYIQMEFKSSREIRTAKLSMIDLAGSERGSATGFGGVRFTEGANINKSLLALGNCINSLADGQRYIPYRDSKLTRLLKDSLGGNCQTVMIANISPSSLSYEDTYNTLKYAARAKKIKSNVKRNVVNVELHVGEYVKIVEDLKKELEKVKGQLREKVTEKKVDPEVSVRLLKLMDTREKLLHRMYNLECSESMVALRRRLKEEADSRVSVLFNDTPEREEAHRRLENSCNRFHRQEDTLNSELAEMKLSKLDLENQSKELVQQNPDVQELYLSENIKLVETEKGYQAELLQKKCTLLEQELKNRATVLEKSCKMLQSCYLQLRGHGLASDNLHRDYQEVLNYVQGRRNVTWDSPVDSGLSSTTSISSVDSENRQTKRRFEEGPRGIVSLDSTFIMEPPKAKVRVCTQVSESKVCKSPSINKARNIKCAPRPLQENRRIAANVNARYLSTVNKTSVTKSKQDLVKKRPFRT